MDVNGDIIYDCQNLEATKMSLSKWEDKLTMVHPDNGILLSPKKKWADKPWNDIQETSMYITKWKKPIWKGYLLRDSNNDILGKAKL